MAEDLNAVAGSEEITSGESAGDIGGGAPDTSSAPSAPVADAWTPPSREAWESLQKQHAEIAPLANLGREFAPHANHIRSLIQQGFSPQQAKAEVKAQVQQEAAYRAHFEPSKREETWKRFGQDPAFYERTIQDMAREGLKGDLDEVKSLKAELKAMKDSHDELRGWAIRGNAAFQQNPEFTKYEKAALEHVHAGRIGDLHTAVEFVKAQERIKEYEAKSVAAPKVAPKPSPRIDASAPRAGVGRGAPAPAASAPVGRNRVGQFESTLRAAAAKIRGS